LIFVYHNTVAIVDVRDSNEQSVSFPNSESISEGLCLLAQDFDDEIIVWCHTDYATILNKATLELLFHHKKLLLSYNPSKTPFLDATIGYIDASPFAGINSELTFGTWQMSSAVGGIHASVLLAVQDKMHLDKDFDYFLCSLAKLAMPKGLLCYSEPRLLIQHPEVATMPANTYTLFRFAKQHYRTRWIFLLLLNLFLYERKFPLVPFLFALFYKNRTQTNFDLDHIKVHSSKKVVDKGTVDVIIPTIGRKNYLYDVLKDFSKQTQLPKKIIIVEQNPLAESTSELDYLTTEKWPFEIQHIFTHRAGACNARNLALDQTQSEWVFLADDDNRFAASLLSEIFEKINHYGNPILTTSYPQKNEIKKYNTVIQWPTFGAGNSFVRRDLLQQVRFLPALEFGYGEDVDFGMQLRNLGYDVLYVPEPEILHLKAPIGGFRTKPVLPWQNDVIQPKPSPTIMLYQLLHTTKAQHNSYKTTFFFKYYRSQPIKNPIRYYHYFQKQWGRSVFWANELKRQNEV